jgi:hypothetical protein
MQTKRKKKKKNLDEQLKRGIALKLLLYKICIYTEKRPDVKRI